MDNIRFNRDVTHAGSTINYANFSRYHRFRAFQVASVFPGQRQSCVEFSVSAIAVRAAGYYATAELSYYLA